MRFQMRGAVFFFTPFSRCRAIIAFHASRFVFAPDAHAGYRVA